MLSIWMNSQLPILDPAAPELPQIQNGGFADATNWALTAGGGTGSMSITGGQLVQNAGTLGTGVFATQTLTGLAAFVGQSVVFAYDYVGGSRALAISLGGGVEVNTVSNSPGTGLTLTVVVGGSNENLRIRATSPLSGGAVIDNVSIALA